MKFISKGDVYGRLTVIEFVRTLEGKRSYRVYKCRCECGNFKEVASYSLTSGNVRSCGCLRSDNTKKMAQRTNKSHTNIGLVEKKTIRSNNKSGYNGVYQNSKGSWIATIMFQGKRKYLGSFENIKDAINERKNAEKEINIKLEEIKKSLD